MKKAVYLSIAFVIAVNMLLPLPEAECKLASVTAKPSRHIKLPKGYHEGVLIEDGRIIVNNGKGINTWIFDLASGEKVDEVTPVATFSEGISPAGGGRYWFTDWDTKKLYLVRIEDKRMVVEREISVDPAHPTGVAWTGSLLYVVTWTRGVTGTKYHILEFDGGGALLRKTPLRHVQEPSQLAWDGKKLWVSSWFSRRVYSIDIKTMEVTGYFRSRIKDTTGIAYDGKALWATGTNADLYQFEFTP